MPHAPSLNACPPHVVTRPDARCRARLAEARSATSRHSHLHLWDVKVGRIVDATARKIPDTGATIPIDGLAMPHMSVASRVLHVSLRERGHLAAHGRCSDAPPGSLFPTLACHEWVESGRGRIPGAASWCRIAAGNRIFSETPDRIPRAGRSCPGDRVGSGWERDRIRVDVRSADRRSACWVYLSSSATIWRRVADILGIYY